MALETAEKRKITRRLAVFVFYVIHSYIHNMYYTRFLRTYLNILIANRLSRRVHFAVDKLISFVFPEPNTREITHLLT